MKKNITNIESECSSTVEDLNALCVCHKDNDHSKLKALCRELLNDWSTIFRQLKNTAFPITNNPAEEIIRHWVISRRLSYGTKTLEGTRAFGILASVISTCRLRKANVWALITEVIASARRGLPLPALPSGP